MESPSRSGGVPRSVCVCVYVRLLEGEFPTLIVTSCCGEPLPFWWCSLCVCVRSRVCILEGGFPTLIVTLCCGEPLPFWWCSPLCVCVCVCASIRGRVSYLDCNLVLWRVPSVLVVFSAVCVCVCVCASIRGRVSYLDCNLVLWRVPSVLVVFSAVFTRHVFVQQVLDVKRLVTDRTRKLTT